MIHQGAALISDFASCKITSVHAISIPTITIITITRCVMCNRAVWRSSTA